MMSKKELVKEYVAKQIAFLSAQKDTSIGKAQLANLRRGIGKIPGELPELWGTFLNYIPDELLSNSGNPTQAEWAIYLALTLYALHQQGNAENVHVKNISLGKAAIKLADQPTDEERERILRRFGPVITAKDMPEFAHHLRGMIQLFKAKGIKLDYIKLAGDIYDFQFEQSRKKVQLHWGQDFYYTEKEEKGEKES